MRRYNITNKAVEDLNSIWIYTFETWSEQQADKYYKELTREFSIIVSSTKTNDKNYEEICHGLRGHKCNKTYHFLLLLSAKPFMCLNFLQKMNSIINYWCPLNIKRHNKTVCNASKYGIADLFLKNKPPSQTTRAE